MNPNRAIERLVKEWKEHSKIVIAVDFDDTISPWKFNDREAKRLYKRIAYLLHRCKIQGCYISIWSACNPDRFPEIEKYCKELGVEIDSINKNPIDLPYGNDKKMFANIYLDDRAGLNESLYVLETALYILKGEDNSKAVMQQIF